MKEEDMQKQPLNTFKGEFKPTAERLKEIANGCADALENATEEELGEFVEIGAKTGKPNNGQ